MSEELKPCPFCDSEDVFLARNGGDSELLGFVSCSKCMADGPIIYVEGRAPREHEALVIEAWNTRATGVESWPDWKKDYKLTESSAPQNEKD